MEGRERGGEGEGEKERSTSVRSEKFYALYFAPLTSSCLKHSPFISRSPATVRPRTDIVRVPRIGQCSYDAFVRVQIYRVRNILFRRRRANMRKAKSVTVSESEEESKSKERG